MVRLPESRSARPAVDINGFFEVVQQALALYIKTEGPPKNINPVLVEEFPRERITKQDDSFDIITFRVKTSSMAASTNTGTVPRRPSLRGTIVHPEKGPNYQLDVYGWWELIQAEFTVWSRSNKNANQMAEWFHVFLMKYAYFSKYFDGRGIENFQFLERADEDVDHNTGQEIYKRRLTYEFRLNRLISTETRNITNITLDYGIANDITQVDLTSNTQI